MSHSFVVVRKGSKISWLKSIRGQEIETALNGGFEEVLDIRFTYDAVQEALRFRKAEADFLDKKMARIS
jgi:hypothetical protein